MKKPSNEDLTRQFQERIGQDSRKTTRSDDRAFNQVKQHRDYAKIREETLKQLGLK